MTLRTIERVVVGMSGGVDSSVAALLLKRQGYQVEGLFMKNWDEDDASEGCSAETDLRDVEAVCRLLDIPWRAVNFSFEYWEKVFERFLQEYGAGRTPNPDILCNKEIKFRAFLDFALENGADAIATGHYARCTFSEKGFHLMRGIDRDKDQSYFLYALGQRPLSHSLFPVGELTKSQVRAMARESGFPTYAKKDSTGICFIGERRFKTFLQRFLPAQPGPIETLEGQKIGQHDGLMYYTLGQRQGLGIGGLRNATSEPWYVAGKDLERNTLIVVQGGHHPALQSSGLIAGDLHWTSGKPPAMPLRCTLKVRYRQADQLATVTKLDDDKFQVLFQTPQRAVTPGQSVVFYRGDECLGGGVIETLLGNAACYQIGLQDNHRPKPVTVT